MTDLAGKVVWVTGASGGLGEGLALQAALRGAKLVLSARRESELERVRQRCPRPHEVALLPLDLERMDDPAEVVRRAGSLLGQWGRISPDTWAILAETMDRRAQMDLLYSIGFFTMNIWAVGTMGVALEPDFAEFSRSADQMVADRDQA